MGFIPSLGGLPHSVSTEVPEGAAELCVLGGASSLCNAMSLMCRQSLCMAAFAVKLWLELWSKRWAAMAGGAGTC